MALDLARKLAAEGLGCAVLTAAGLGAGLQVGHLAADPAMALLVGALPVAFTLTVLITVLGPVSGGHVNPIVTLAFAMRGDIGRRDALAYVLAQIAGAFLGVGFCHAMFGLPLFELGTTARGGLGLWISEVGATFGLIFVILTAVRTRPEAVPGLVGLYMAAAICFSASGAFANPAVTIARGFSAAAPGIHPVDAAGFVAAQIVGTVGAALFDRWLFARSGCVPTA